MAQAHGDRLTAVDASFLAQEVENAHMHVGAVLIFEGPPPDYDDFCTQIRSRLHLVPRYRQKLAFPPLETGRPLWVDDPHFNLEYHVRHTALPAPGLRGAAARARRARALAAAGPLQAAVGDVARAGARGQPLRADLQDPPRARRRRRGRGPRDRACSTSSPCRSRPRTRASRGCPQPEPSAAQLAARGRARARAHAVRAHRQGAVGGDAPDAHAGGRARGDRGRRRGRVGRAEPGAGDAAQRADRPAPAVRVRAQRAGRLQDGQGRARRHGQRRRAHRRGRRAAPAGCARAACAPRGSSCARWCRSRSARRTSTTRSATGSPRCAGRCRSTSRTRSRGCAVVREAMDGLKDSKQAVGAEVLAGVQSFAPPTVLAQASRINFSTRLFNLIVTNVPGPAVPPLPARARAAGPVPDRVPAARPRARGGDHVLQRRDRLRAARRLRRDARPRRVRRATSRSSLDELRGRPPRPSGRGEDGASA